MMGRREFITLIGGAAAWPIAARAQQSRPMVGFISGGSPGPFAYLVRAFRQGLNESGYTEGQNLAIEFRWAEGRYERLPELVTDLIRRGTSVLAATTTPGALAAKAATTTIPIVFATDGDPVLLGLASSLSRPGGNVTGVTQLNVEVAPKRVELAHELNPAATVIALLVNPTNPLAEAVTRDSQAAAHAFGVRLHVLHATTDRDFDAVFKAVVQLRAAALVIASGDPLFGSRAEQLGALALHHRVPAIQQFRAFAAAGGLASYGGSFTDSYRQVGLYTGRILRGEKPGDLPIQQSTKMELVLNLKTAKALGLNVPSTLLGGAAVAWPVVARAQRIKNARIGFLGLVSPSSHAARVAALRAGLRDLGWVEGRNIDIEFRWAEGNYDRLSALAEELVRLNVDVLVTHSTSGALAAKKATSTIPIVITAVADMLAVNLVSSLSRPGGNITGLSFFNAELTAKRLELVKEASPPLTKAAILLNPRNASNTHILTEIETTAKALNIVLEIIEAGQASDLDRAFAAMTDRQVGAIVLHEDPMLTANATALAVLAAVKRLPSCGFPEFGRAGGLLAYGINFPDMEYRAAAFVDKILKGASPAELPIERATKFNITANLQTAKALGITLPTSILLRADEVIE